MLLKKEMWTAFKTVATYHMTNKKRRQGATIENIISENVRLSSNQTNRCHEEKSPFSSSSFEN
jgi:hypothetical protein